VEVVKIETGEYGHQLMDVLIAVTAGNIDGEVI